MLKKEIMGVIKYFAFFDYVPSSEEIYTFLKVKTTRPSLDKALKKITLPKKKNRSEISIKKLVRIGPYVRLLCLFPQIKLIGLSGSIAMMHAAEKDDVDLFIITAKDRLWTGRFIAVFLALLFGLKRSRGVKKARNKLCLNLFFDERELIVPKFKRSEYVAHEILQMKPLFTRGDVYQRFLKANEWVYKIFPNSANSISKHETLISKQYQNSNLENLNLFRISNLGFRIFFNSIENLLKMVQLYFINRHKTTEIITNTQLWFHPIDFEKKLL